MGVTRAAQAATMVDLLTGDSSLFTSTIGSWASSSGAVTRDTTASNTYAVLLNSLKWVSPSTSTDYVECPVVGTFLAGVEYQAVVALMMEEFVAADFDVTLGLQGTDVATNSPHAGANAVGAIVSKRWLLLFVSWTPSASRTGVKLRVKRTSSSGGTLNVHVGYARVVRPGVGAGLMAFTDQRLVGTSIPAGQLIVPMGKNGGLFAYLGGGISSVSGNSGPSLEGGTDAVTIDGGGQHNAVVAANRDGTVYASAGGDNAAADLTNNGYEFDVGIGYLDWCVNQKDASTIQFFSKSSQSDLELANNGTGKWKIRDGSVIKSLTALNERKAQNATATIASGSTSIVVTHSAGYTPSAQDFVVVPTNNPTNDPGNWWVSTITSTQFTINCRTDPGAGGMTFAWRVDR